MCGIEMVKTIYEREYYIPMVANSICNAWELEEGSNAIVSELGHAKYSFWDWFLSFYQHFLQIFLKFLNFPGS